MTRLSFTAIDFETANAQRASVCSVGLVKVENGQVVDRFTSLIHPPPGLETFEPRNVNIHGITADDVAGAPHWFEVAREVEAIAQDDVLVAHNAAFDRSVFEGAYDAYDLNWPVRDWLCTLALSKKSLRVPSYGLPWVSEHLGLDPFDHHDALADAMAAANVLLVLAERLDLRDMQAVIGQSRRRVTAEDISDEELGLDGVEGVPNSFADEVVCFTGKITLKRKDAEELAEKLGATISRSVTRQTTVLVVGGFSEGSLRPGAQMSLKLEKAVESVAKGQRLEILTESEYLVRIADEKEEIKKRLAQSAMTSFGGGSTWLPDWALDAVRSMGVGNDWLRFLREVRHPDGRAQGGELCIRCGELIEPSAHYQHRNRHVCGINCNTSLKRAWRRIGKRDGLFGSESADEIAAYQEFFRRTSR